MAEYEDKRLFVKSNTCYRTMIQVMQLASEINSQFTG